MIRRAVRFLIAPVARWAAEGAEHASWVGRDEIGAHIAFEDAYGNVGIREFGIGEAKLFADTLVRAAWDHAEGMPLIQE